MGECFFWYQPTRVVPDQRPLNGCMRVCVHTPDFCSHMVKKSSCLKTISGSFFLYHLYSMLNNLRHLLEERQRPVIALPIMRCQSWSCSVDVWHLPSEGQLCCCIHAYVCVWHLRLLAEGSTETITLILIVPRLRIKWNAQTPPH